MTEEPLQGRDQVAAECLRQMDQLASEISTASDAISANQMQRFRESVERQQMLCSSLSSISKTVHSLLTAPKAPSADVRLEQRIRAACLELQNLNFKYAALLRHSGRSVALLSLLHKCQSGEVFNYGEPKRQTCSYEG